MYGPNQRRHHESCTHHCADQRLRWSLRPFASFGGSARHLLDVGPEPTCVRLYRPRSPPPEWFRCSQASVWCSVLGPAHSRPIVRSHSSSMVSDRSLQYVDDAWSAFMVVHRAEDASRLDGHHPHSKLAPGHALDLRAKVNRCKYLRRNTFGRRCRPFVAHRALLSALPGPNVRPSTQDELISDTRPSRWRRQRQPALVSRCFQEPHVADAAAA